MYGSKWRNSYWGGDICYYIWNGSAWVWVDWIQGNVNTTEEEEEPFITFDGQNLYFDRWDSYHHDLYVADWNGSGFINSRLLNSNITNGNSRCSSITQDMQYLYFTKDYKIYVSVWNGNDWGAPTLLPASVNEGGGMFRWNVTITPDGNEIYFTGAGSYVNRLAFSKKIAGVWQQWQYCDYNINPPGSTDPVSCPAFTYSDYSSQYLYFERDVPGIHHFRSLRSPVSVQPTSLGAIKAYFR